MTSNFKLLKFKNGKPALIDMSKIRAITPTEYGCNLEYGDNDKHYKIQESFQSFMNIHISLADQIELKKKGFTYDPITKTN